MTIVAMKFTGDEVSPALRRLIKKTRNLSRAMQKVETLVLRPKKEKAWATSGLVSRSGELEGAVQTWHGKKSTGISVHTDPGKDLVIPKAVTQTEGARKHQYRKKPQRPVRRHSRDGRVIGRYMRRNVGSPWGDVKARPFIPTALGAAEQQVAERIILEAVDV